MFRTRGCCLNKRRVLTVAGLIIFIMLFISFLDHPKTRYIFKTTRLKMNSIFYMDWNTELTNVSDYNRLININFTFEMLPLVCNETEDILLILVHSASDHFNHRKVIRETWGQNNESIRLLFLIGIVEDVTMQKKLEEESELHSDLLQGSFVDTYHNLTYKHVMGLKYAVYHCPNIQFLLKVDDDVFVNVPVLKKFTTFYLCQNGKPKSIFCSRLVKAGVFRTGKWATSLKEYPASHYPNYCGGFAILYPHDVVYTLYHEAQKTKFFWVDDVFVSGICAEKSNVDHIGIEDLILSNEDVHKIVDLSFTNVTKPFLVGTINLSENQIRVLWNVVSNHPSKTMIDYLKYN